jgi:hypothetical protein
MEQNEPKECPVNIQRLAEQYGTLNSWGWPDDIPMPEGMTDPGDHDCPERMEHMDRIEGLIGRRAILRVHNKDMGDEEFVAWAKKNRI